MRIRSPTNGNPPRRHVLVSRTYVRPPHNTTSSIGDDMDGWSAWGLRGRPQQLATRARRVPSRPCQPGGRIGSGHACTPQADRCRPPRIIHISSGHASRFRGDSIFAVAARYATSAPNGRLHSPPCLLSPSALARYLLHRPLFPYMSHAYAW